MTPFITNYLGERAAEFKSSESFFKRHVVSRLTYALMVMASLVARVADGIIGVLAAVGSFCYLGTNEQLNVTAFKGFQAVTNLRDIFIYSIKCMNPWAKT